LYKSACSVLVRLCHAESLTGLVGVCFCVHVCVTSQSRVFCPVPAPGSHGKKWICSHIPLLSSEQTKLPKADPSCLPSLPISGDFNHLHSVPRPLLEAHLHSENRSNFRVLFYHLLLLTSTPLLCCFVHHWRKEKTKSNKPPLCCHLPLFLAFIMWGIRKCLLKAIELCFNNT